MPFRSPVPAVFLARGHQEVVIRMADVRILKQTLHIGNHNLTAPVEPVLPESLGPFHVFDTHASQFDVLALRGIGQCARIAQAGRDHPNQKNGCNALHDYSCTS